MKIKSPYNKPGKLIPGEAYEKISKRLDLYDSKKSLSPYDADKIFKTISQSPLTSDQELELLSRLQKLREASKNLLPHKSFKKKKLQGLPQHSKSKKRKMSEEEVASLYRIHSSGNVVYEEPAVVIYNHNGRK